VKQTLASAYNGPVPAQIVFLTLYLGLTSGLQPFDFQVGRDVRSVRVLVDGRESAVVNAPPWRTLIDLGPAFEPREVIAVAYDRDGDEVGRTAQLINLPRPAAEVNIELQKDQDGISAALRWENVYGAQPVRNTISVDGKSLHVNAQLHARLPALDANKPHIINAEMHFADGVVARREVVIAGEAISDSISSELTPIVVTESRKTVSVDGCFSAHGNPLRARTAETVVEVAFVREPNVNEFANTLDPDRVVRNGWRSLPRPSHQLALDPGTTMHYMWPIVRRIEAPGHVASNIFDMSDDISSRALGLPGFLILAFDANAENHPLEIVEPGSQRRFADAVAVAAVNAVAAAHRRAVVLVVDCTFDLEHDNSSAEPAAVRRYLESIGVPLFVWSVSGPRPDLETEWGDIDDISTPNQLRLAVERLRSTLASQRVVWISSDPLTALRVDADPRCGITPLAHLGGGY
jgi:hypothetical protein